MRALRAGISGVSGPLVGAQADEPDKDLAYFQTNTPDALRGALGIFVGSGVVEAGCKPVIGQRLKLSGVRWSTPDATGITTPALPRRRRRVDKDDHKPRTTLPTNLSHTPRCIEGPGAVAVSDHPMIRHYFATGLP